MKLLIKKETHLKDPDVILDRIIVEKVNDTVAVSMLSNENFISCFLNKENIEEIASLIPSCIEKCPPSDEEIHRNVFFSFTFDNIIMKSKNSNGAWLTKNGSILFEVGGLRTDIIGIINNENVIFEISNVADYTVIQLIHTISYLGETISSENEFLGRKRSGKLTSMPTLLKKEDD
jgi:hypothetical protein